MTSRRLPIRNLSGVETIADVRKALQGITDYLLAEQQQTTATAESSSLLESSKANVGHDHADLYYLKAAVDAALALKAPVSHTHLIADVTDYVAPKHTNLVWSEEGSALSTSTGGGFQWSFGNGTQTPVTRGLVILAPCTLVALGLCAGAGAGASGTVEVFKNGVATGTTVTITASTTVAAATGLSVSFAVGDYLNFKTVSVTGTVSGPCYMTALLEST